MSCGRWSTTTSNVSLVSLPQKLLLCSPFNCAGYDACRFPEGDVWMNFFVLCLAALTTMLLS